VAVILSRSMHPYGSHAQALEMAESLSFYNLHVWSEVLIIQHFLYQI